MFVHSQLREDSVVSLKRADYCCVTESSVGCSLGVLLQNVVVPIEGRVRLPAAKLIVDSHEVDCMHFR